MRRRAAPAVVACLLAAACSGGGDDSASTTTGAPSVTAETEVPPPAEPTGDVADCPAAFRDAGLTAGQHDGFESGGQQRSFHLLLPGADAGEAGETAPLFVSLTGTVQEEASFMAQSELDRLPEDGWIVVAPVRNQNGLIWGPWDAMRTAAQTGPNPDEALVLDLIACVSAHHAVDPDRIFVGGISVGGTFTTYLLRRHSDLFAGGVVGSGNFVLTEPPDQQALDDMTVVVSWGGDADQWTGCPDGRMGPEYADVEGCVSVDFVPEAAATIEYFASEPAVAVLACTEDVGHIWITSATTYWADLLAARPKGTTDPIDVGTPPPAMTCTPS